MSELLTQSRPYAEAIFEIAKDEKSLDIWVDDLSKVVSAMQEDTVRTLIDSPDLSQRNKAEIFVSLFEGEISKKVSNFVLVIGQANRLKLLEKVLENFKSLVALEKKQKNVTVASSYSLEQDQIERIKSALQKKNGF
jgi:F-type H+-transporting ATPase subunit delta